MRPLETGAPRTAASIHLGAVVVVCILAALSMPGLPMAGSASPKMVRLIGNADAKKPCDRQTWPYIEERCLTREVPDSAAAVHPAQQANVPPQQSTSAPPGAGNPSAELTPLTASGGKVVPGRASASADSSAAPAVVDGGVPQASTGGMAYSDQQDEPMQSEPRKRRHRHHGSFFGFRF